jgi:hypothetical protein
VTPRKPGLIRKKWRKGCIDSWDLRMKDIAITYLKEIKSEQSHQ